MSGKKPTDKKPQGEAKKKEPYHPRQVFYNSVPAEAQIWCEANNCEIMVMQMNAPRMYMIVEK